MGERNKLGAQALDLKGIVERIYRLVPALIAHHGTKGDLYAIFSQIVKAYFTNYRGAVLDAAPLKGIVWPYVDMGKVSSHDLITLDEIILFRFYSINRARYRTVFDIGANIGLHSIVLSRLDYTVYAFEPDDGHYRLLIKNAAANRCGNIQAFRKAVSDRSGVAEFLRVKANTTASHIAGSRDFYGGAKSLRVETISFDDVGVQPDLIKIDVEGHEKTVLLGIDRDQWKRADAIVEVHSSANAKAIFNYFRGTNINIFAQNLGWGKVRRLVDMPKTYKDGHVFISRKKEMPWRSGRGGFGA